MAQANLTHAKIVANPSAYTWSQAYNAGKLFSVLSLETHEETEEKDFLNVVGKEILDTLQQEFFTLETKDLESIKKAVETTAEKIPNNILTSFVIAAFIENVLYLYIIGAGKVSLKRDEKLGLLLDSENNDPKAFKNGSGFLQNNDIVILETNQFANVITQSAVSEFLDKNVPSDAAEYLAPLIHEKDEPGAAAIIIDYKHIPETKEEAFLLGRAVEEENIQVKTLKEIEEKESPFYSSSFDKKTNIIDKIKSRFLGITPKISLRPNSELNHSRKIILTIVIVIFAVLSLSIVFALKKQQDSKVQAVFQSVYPQALKKFEEGKSLLDLNQGLAQDSFIQAKKLLENGKSKLPQNSSEEKKLLSLLDQVNQSITLEAKPSTAQAKAVDLSTSNILNIESKNQGLYFSIDSNFVYGITNDSIYSIKPDGTDKKTIVKNNDYWTSAGGLANYFGNLYVLDKKSNQILKFVESESEYSKTNYLSDNSNIDFSKAISIAIDSSIYVLSTNGTVLKFTKGNQDSFKISGLDKELLNPTRITTSADNDFVYILDNGNSRIVVLEKSGKYKSAYQSSVIKQAKDIDIDEENQKAFVLSGGKVYQIDLNN